MNQIGKGVDSVVFAEKLAFLMRLTGCSNKQLAEAVNVDPSLISRFRNARREAPRNRTYAKTMAEYFAKKCEGDYQRMALSEAMERKQLSLHMDAEHLAAILYDWLTDSRDQVGQFLNTFESFSLAMPEPYAQLPAASAKNESKCYAYYGNEGKRGAISAFVAHLIDAKAAGMVYLSSDEDMTWLFEEPAYLKRMQEQISVLLKRGHRLTRIGMPLASVDAAFDSLSRWLPLYMTGAVESFYYPRLRDEMYRRTIITMPEVAAVVSYSTHGQALSRATLFTSDARLSNAYTGDFLDILAKCRPMMMSYSTAVNAEPVLRCIAQFESDKGNRIQQSTLLSSITAPAEHIRLSVKDAPAKEANSIVEAMSQAQEMFRQSLSEFEVIDIHTLSSIEDIAAGVVPVSVAFLSGKPPLCHTPLTYAQHLRSILDHLERYGNYHAVLLPPYADTHALMVKDGRQALLLRPGIPLTVFEVTQPYVAEACREYLLRHIDTSQPAELQRKNTIAQLKRLIAKLEEIW